LFSAIVVVSTFLVLEGGLRWAGFDHPTTVEAMAFTFPIDEYNQSAPTPFLERDPLLFWKPKPLVMGHNSKGTWGAEFADAKPAGTYRIVALGDSCTHFGPDPYPQRLQMLLEKDRPGRFEVINAGVIGYSSFQGLTRLKNEVTQWSPDLITVYFGWNDHWLARGLSDREQSTGSRNLSSTYQVLDHLRAFQLVAWLAGRGRPSAGDVRYRVSLEDYGSNLREMKRAADALGARIVFITAPHALDLGVPAYLATSGEVADMTGLIDLHERYNEQVRAVAHELAVPVVDLDRQFETMNKAVLFNDDHIHLSDAGRTLAARALRDMMTGEGLLKDAGHQATPAGR